MVQRLTNGFVILVVVGFLAIFGSLIVDGLGPFISGDLLKEGYWAFDSASYQALSFFFSTVLVSILALAFAVPLGLGAAVCLSELLTGKARVIGKMAIELMAGVPSVVYGLLGVTFLLPLLSPWLMAQGGISGDSHFSAGLLLGIMILPTVVTFSDDAMRCIPGRYREEGLGMGLSKAQVVLFIVMPRAKEGIISAILLGLGRALGETIAVYLLIGRADQNFRWNAISFDTLFMPGQTLTTKLGGAEIAIAYGDAEHWGALMALALYLWILVAAISFIGMRLGREKAL